MTTSQGPDHEGKVLVVDDEPDARALLKRVLEDKGAVVVTAASTAEAMELLATDRPDIIVSDIGMPDEDGHTLIRRIRALGAEKGGKTPALALTAYARTEDRTRSILAGFQAHISKPVAPAELLAMVNSLAGMNLG
jgi:CheY-like chemotaxis protein